MLPAPAEPVDEESITNDAALWRRIPPKRWMFDHNRERVRPARDCFKYWKDPDTQQKHPMSVLLGNEMESPAAAIVGHPDGYKVVAFPASLPREHGLGVCRNPIDGWPAHADVFSPSNEIPKSARRAIADAAVWIIELTPQEIEEAKAKSSSD